MKAVVIGLGSMGKRRVRLIRAFFEGIMIAGVDRSEARCRETARLFGIPCYPSVSEALAAESPDVGFVCSSPLSHGEITAALLRGGLHVFSEINLSADGYDQNTALAEKNGRVLFLSSTPMYRREIEYITEAVSGAGGLRYRYHAGQYLPDWHPWEDYRDFFVGDRRTNGCRELFAIEFPWMEKAFGRFSDISAEPARLTSLSIDYPDCYLLTARHEGGASGQMMIDVVSRKPVRDLEIIGETLYLRWGGTPDSLSVYDTAEKCDRPIRCYDSVLRDPRYADNILEDAYVAELSAFFETVEGRDRRRHRFEDNGDILRLIDRIEGVTG